MSGVRPRLLAGLLAAALLWGCAAQPRPPRRRLCWEAASRRRSAA